MMWGLLSGFKSLGPGEQDLEHVRDNLCFQCQQREPVHMEFGKYTLVDRIFNQIFLTTTPRVEIRNWCSDGHVEEVRHSNDSHRTCTGQSSDSTGSWMKASKNGMQT